MIGGEIVVSAAGIGVKLLITQLSIENFRKLIKCELSSLKRVNLIGGKNNSGKSTVLEALFFFYDRQHPASILRLHNSRGVHLTDRSSFGLFSPVFYEYDMSKTMEIRVVEDFKETILTAQMVKQNKRNIQMHIGLSDQDASSETKPVDPSLFTMHVYDGSVKNEPIETVVHSVKGEEIEVEVGSVHQEDMKKAVFLTARSPVNSNENAKRYGELVKRNRESVVLKYLQMIEPRLQSITAVQQQNNEAVLYGDIGLSVKMQLQHMGDGINRVLSILLAIFTSPDGVVLIDEMENGIHHSILRDFWSMIDLASKEQNCQLFITTHSYECLHALVESDMEKNNVNYVRLEQTEMKTAVKEYSYENLLIAIENGWEVR